MDATLISSIKICFNFFVPTLMNHTLSFYVDNANRRVLATRLILCAIGIFTLAFPALKALKKDEDPHNFNEMHFLYAYNSCAAVICLLLSLFVIENTDADADDDNHDDHDRWYMNFIIALIFATFLNVRLGFFAPSIIFDYITQLENGQRNFTRMIYRRNNPPTTVIQPYDERLKLFEMVSLHQRRMVKDIMTAYNFLASNPNSKIDLQYVPLSHSSNGYYSSNFFALGKYASTHFSTRVASLLIILDINSLKYEKPQQLRNHLSTIDLTDRKILKYVA